MNNYEQIMNAKGYYCDMCNCYHTEDEMIYTYTFKTVGKPVGLIHPDSMHEAIACPECEEGDELKEFNPLEWSHLCAYLDRYALPVCFVYPIFESDYFSDIIGYGYADSVEELQKVADSFRETVGVTLCIEIEEIYQKANNEKAFVKVDLV